MSFINVAAGIGAVGGIFKIGQGMHQNHLANKINVPIADYTTSPYAVAMLGEANRLKNARMPGAVSAQQSILGNEANTQGEIERNATNGTAALKALLASQGGTENSLNSLAGQEGNYGLTMENNWNNANEAMINEGDKVYQNQLEQQQLAMNEKNALRGAGMQNIGGGMNDMTNIAYMLALQKANK